MVNTDTERLDFLASLKSVVLWMGCDTPTGHQIWPVEDNAHIRVHIDKAIEMSKNINKEQSK